MVNRTQEKINVRNNSELDIAYIAESQGMTITGFVRLAVKEFCEKRNIPKSQPSSNLAA